jgi:Domain of unknown function (DUF427)
MAAAEQQGQRVVAVGGFGVGRVTACPYKGTTSGYWSVRAGGTVYDDLAWSYDFPTSPLLPKAGLIAFYNERVDIILDGQRLRRPETHFFPR